MSKSKHILVLNAGSSTLKFAGYAVDSMQCIYKGMLDQHSEAHVTFTVKHLDNAGASCQQELQSLDADPILAWLQQQGLDQSLLGIGHRVVHGGEHFNQPTLIDAEVKQAVKANSIYAPLHNPANLAGIEFFETLFPGIPQVAIFDTAFHHSMPAKAYLYPLPYKLYTEQGVRRYGFHGSSHQYVSITAACQLDLALDQSHFISIHLGNGCSTAAISQGKSVDTSMGLTPLEGLMMGTRCGNIDPGLAQFLCHAQQWDVDELTKVLNKQSGLLGISQISSDMRELTQAAGDGHEQAQLAIDMFCYRAAKSIAEMLVALPKVDALIFTGGIGENAADIREKIIQQLAFLKFQLDHDANQQHGHNNSGIIATGNDCIAVVTPTDEEKMIAQQCAEVLLQTDPTETQQGN